MARITDEKQIISLMGNVKTWYHQIELAPKIVTPGINDSSVVLKNLDALGLPKDGSLLRVLDIGCRDGFFAFEMEKRGAQVVGVDYAPPDVTGFQIASQILDSKVTYVTDNVYNLNPEKYGAFDLVLFLGVLYHLRNPLLALDQIRTMIKPGGLLFAESQLSTDDRLNTLDIPVWQFYPRNTLNNDETNKWAPNLSGLKFAVEEAEFIVQDSLLYGNRGYVKSQAVTDSRQQYFRHLDSSIGIFGVSQTHGK
jgi:tRNA (mo5U34)-methyltransferase